MNSSLALFRNALLALVAFALFTPTGSAQSSSHTEAVKVISRCVSSHEFLNSPRLSWQAYEQLGATCANSSQPFDACNLLYRAAALAPEVDQPALWIRARGSCEPLVHRAMRDVRDPGSLAMEDREFMLQFGKAEDAERVRDSSNNRSYILPDAIVIAVSPTQLKLAVSNDACFTHTADFTLNLDSPAASIPQPGQTLTIEGTFSSYAANQFIMITLDRGRILPQRPGTLARQRICN